MNEAQFYYLDLYGRIARVVKSLKSPPIHLPGPWSEFHYKNRLAFFALPITTGSYRWIVDTDNSRHCVRFGSITHGDKQVDLTQYEPNPWPSDWTRLNGWIQELRNLAPEATRHEGLVEEVDLKVIGSSSVVQNRSYEAWQALLSEEQKNVLGQKLQNSVRIIGPAGSGKTLALCLRAIAISRDTSTTEQAKKILIVTHSWAMAERIDGVIETLADGEVPDSITVLPLLYVLQLHGGQPGRQAIDIHWR